MDPPPPPTTLPHPDSTASSPRSRPDTTPTCNFHDHHHHLAAKLRLMCSYGGHIIPRPHDKSLCYVGGDTRIVVIDRHPATALADLHTRLSHTLLNGRQFTLKYQLPTEELDSLISITTDEDLDNMIEEHDRLTNATSPLNPTRLRLFLFPTRPETASSMGCLLDDAKSETWFVDALNGSGLLPRGLSDSAAIDNLLELDQCTGIEIEDSNKSKMMEIMNNSSFGSSSSSPSSSNLAAIRVRIEDQNVGSNFPNSISSASSVINCEDEKLDQQGNSGGGGAAAAAASGFRKPPLPLQMVQRKFGYGDHIHNLPSPDSKHAGGYNLPSPDSVASDCSIASAGSLSKNAVYQDATNRETRVLPTLITTDQKPTNNTQEPISQISMQQQQQLTDPPPQIPLAHQNQQFMHPNPNPNPNPNTHNNNYLQSPTIPIPSYYHPIYLPQQQTQQQSQTTDPQYAMYFLPPHTQNQPCYDPSHAASSRSLTPSPNPMAPNYNDSAPPVYPMKPTEMAANMYSTAAGGTGGAASAPMYVHVPNSHHLQQQYVGYSQIPTQAQAQAQAQSAYANNYGGHDQYSHGLQEQVYYAPVPPPQYQTITPAAAMMMSQASAQIPSDSTNAQQ